MTSTQDRSVVEREREIQANRFGQARTHTHSPTHTKHRNTRAHQHQNGTRDEVKKKQDGRNRQTSRTAHKRELCWLNNEQDLRKNSLIQARGSREIKTKQKNELGRQEQKTDRKNKKKKKTKDPLFHQAIFLRQFL